MKPGDMVMPNPTIVTSASTAVCLWSSKFGSHQGHAVTYLGPGMLTLVVSLGPHPDEALFLSNGTFGWQQMVYFVPARQARR